MSDNDAFDENNNASEENVENKIHLKSGCTIRNKLKSGTLSLSDYSLFSQSDNWKVRCAVAVGLANKKSDKALKLLENLVHDQHYGVVLCAVQKLEEMQTDKSKKILNSLFKDLSFSPKTHRLLIKAVRRSELATHLHVHSLNALRHWEHKGYIRKIHYPNKRGSVLFSKVKIPFNERRRMTSFSRDRYQRNTLDYVVPRSEVVPPKIKEGRPTVFWRYLIWEENRRKKTKVESEITGRVQLMRATKHNTEKMKWEYTRSLFRNGVRTVENANKEKTILPRRIYWALGDAYDPKGTRPVLVTSKISEEGFVTVVPLSSKINNIPSEDLLISISGKTECAEISRLRQMSVSDIFDQRGVLDKDQFAKVGSAIEKYIKEVGEEQLTTPVIRVIR